MALQSNAIEYKGENFFRQRLVLSMLSGRPVRICELRSKDANPGVREFELNALKLLCAISNGSTVDVGATGTEVYFKPGILTGGPVEFDCGNERAIGYYLEMLCYLSPFCKKPLEAKLDGATNSQQDLSVDLFKYAWLPVMRKFILNDEQLDIKIIRRGFFPNCGGLALYNSPACRKLQPAQLDKMGKVKKVRGLAYSCRLSPTMASRCMETAKGEVKRYLNDVYFHSDHRKGAGAGKSPGFGILLSAETTEGVFFVAEKVSNLPKSSYGPSIPEEVGIEAAHLLFYEIYRGGSCTSTAVPLMILFMALCQKDVSKSIAGPLSDYSVNFLRHLKDFFGVVFKVDTASATPREGDQQLCLGYEDKIKLSCVGVGFSNLSKAIL